jgi:hypothetical protein
VRAGVRAAQGKRSRTNELVSGVIGWSGAAFEADLRDVEEIFEAYGPPPEVVVDAYEGWRE